MLASWRGFRKDKFLTPPPFVHVWFDPHSIFAGSPSPVVFCWLPFGAIAVLAATAVGGIPLGWMPTKVPFCWGWTGEGRWCCWVEATKFAWATAECWEEGTADEVKLTLAPLTTLFETIAAKKGENEDGKWSICGLLWMSGEAPKNLFFFVLPTQKFLVQCNLSKFLAPWEKNRQF